jgi:hypothetical protein
MLPDRSDFNLYRFQRRAMPVLLGWALGSIVAGALWLRDPGRFLRGAGGQFVAWGVIDGLIALLALRGAGRKQVGWQANAITPLQHAQEAEQFEKIVWANAALDVGYVLAGRWWSRRNPDDPWRRGMGLGVMVQGAFLLVWDLFLALAVRRGRHGA